MMSVTVNAHCDLCSCKVAEILNTIKRPPSAMQSEYLTNPSCVQLVVFQFVFTQFIRITVTGYFLPNLDLAIFKATFPRKLLVGMIYRDHNFDQGCLWPLSWFLDFLSSQSQEKCLFKIYIYICIYKNRFKIIYIKHLKSILKYIFKYVKFLYIQEFL